MTNRLVDTPAGAGLYIESFKQIAKAPEPTSVQKTVSMHYSGVSTRRSMPETPQELKVMIHITLLKTLLQKVLKDLIHPRIDHTRQSAPGAMPTRTAGPPTPDKERPLLLF